MPHDNASNVYYLAVENHSGEAVIVTPLNDDVEPATGDAFYLIPADGSTWWAGGGSVYARPAAVVVYDANCGFRYRAQIPSNSPGWYRVIIDEVGSVTMAPSPTGLATPPPHAADNPHPCAATAE